MHPRGALFNEGLSDRNGVIAVHSAVVVLTLTKTNNFAPEQVDSGKQIHFPTDPTKFASNANPADADFSGWNCVAKTLLRRNATFNVSP